MGAPSNFDPGHHVMQLYENEDALALSIATFFARGLRRGDPVGMISARHRFDLVKRHLRSEGFGFPFDVVQKIQFLDAEDALNQVFDQDVFDLARLQRPFDDLLTAVRQNRQHTTIWVYGETVDLLCKRNNHEAAIALHFMYYNFARIHQTLRVTPAMEAGLADHAGRWRNLLD